MAIPTTAELAAALITDQETALGQTIPIKDKAYLRVLSVAVGGALSLLHRYAGALFANMFVATASAEPTTINGVTIVPLSEHGREKQAGDRRAATKARLLITQAVTIAGTSVPAGTQLTGKSNGYIYLVQTGVTLTTPTTQITVQAEGDGLDGDGSGEAGNVANGGLLEWLSVPVGATGKTATVSMTLAEGADEERVEDYRLRIQRLAAAPRRGGSPSDYREWATGVPHIARAWVYRGVPGEVEVYVEADNQPHGTPTADQLAAVGVALAYSDDGGLLTADRRPVNDIPIVLASPYLTLDLRISSLTGVSDPTATKARAVDALTQYLSWREPYAEGLSTPPRADFVTSTALLGVVQQVAALDGGTIGSLILTIDGVTYIDLTLGRGERATLGAVSWEA